MTTSLIGRPAVARPTTLLALCGALLLAALIFLPAPAMAHDTLLESDPADGESLETSPEEIALTFSADILEVSPLVRISDESGTEVAEITPTIDGPVATAALPEQLPAGEYSVQWRVVSSDGHPIEGTFAITVEQGPDAATGSSDAGGAEEPAASDAGGAEEPAEDSAAEDPEPATAVEDGFGMTALIAVIAVVVVGAVVTGVVIVRRRD
ncbi:copper resistance CopC family protein [Brachybacterium sp. AOP43-C2-M15]|uniref:copper resistance CopC family protein n=1 Tax=Brachybacterium sp. AOP43-C2-M15 TaxID=3457661 RepID=UPI0040345B20